MAYTEEERLIGLSTLKAHGGNYSRAARECKGKHGFSVSRDTLRGWEARETAGQTPGEAIEARVQQVNETVAAACERVSLVLIQSCADEAVIKAAPLRDRAIAAGVLIDKSQLLRGEATTRSEVTTIEATNPELDQLMVVLRARAAQAARVGEAVTITVEPEPIASE